MGCVALRCGPPLLCASCAAAVRQPDRGAAFRDELAASAQQVRGAPRGAAIRNPLVSPPPGAGGRPSPPEEVEEWLHLIESALKKISSQYGAGMLDSAGDGSVLWAVTEVDGMRKGRYHFPDSATVLA